MLISTFSVIVILIMYPLSLIHIGFLEKDDYRAGIVIRTHSLIPPNETEAKLLENAMRRRDCYMPLVDGEIEAALYPSEVSSRN